MPYKPYEDPTILRRVQIASTKILGEFDRICRELEIPYVVYAGTAIGTVRHQGFIPWDDDVDVCLPRAAYERFIREAPAVMGSEYTIENPQTHPNFTGCYTHFGLVGTKFVPECFTNWTYHKPLSIDVFPLDNMPDDERAYRRQHRRTWLWGRLNFISATPLPYLEVTGPLRWAILSATTVAHWTLRLLRVSPRSLERRWEKAARQFEHEQTEMMADYCDRDPRRWSVRASELFPAIDAPFEDLIVKLPREYDAMLRRNYGDYMAIPPEEERKNHFPTVVVLPD